MNHPALAALTLATVSLLQACKSGPEGTYRLDKDATTAALKSRFPRGDGSLGVTDMKLDLRPKGEYHGSISLRAVTMDGFRDQEIPDSGSWTLDGETLKLHGSGPEVTCKVDEKKLECERDPTGTAITGGQDSPVVFKKY